MKSQDKNGFIILYFRLCSKWMKESESLLSPDLKSKTGWTAAAAFISQSLNRFKLIQQFFVTLCGIFFSIQWWRFSLSLSLVACIWHVLTKAHAQNKIYVQLLECFVYALTQSILLMYEVDTKTNEVRKN